MEGTKKDLDTTNSNNPNNPVNDIESQIKNFLYPECVENSKLISILNKETLSFKFDDFLNLKEIKKISENQETLLKILSSTEFLEKEETKDSETNYSYTFKLKIDDNIRVFSILNIPQKMKKEELIEHFGIPTENLLRVYKKSLFWYVVLNSEEIAKDFKYRLANTSFEKDSKIKFDYLSKQNILDNIKKACHINTYQKETNELKAEVNSNNQTISTKWEKNASSRHNSETLSWRKKSNDQSSNNGDVKYAPKKDSFFKAPFDKNFKRERFNSEGNNKVEKSTGLYRNSKNLNSSSNPNLLSDRNYSSEIEIDISKIKYSLSIKHRYSFIDSAQMLEKLIASGAYELKPKFKIEINEITIENRKNVNMDKLKEKAIVIASPIPQNKFDIPIPNIEELNLNIPKNNPLANFGKPYNKFDEYDPSAI